jgi:hypothetical protein
VIGFNMISAASRTTIPSADALALSRIMSRAGVRASADEFLDATARAFASAQRNVCQVDMQARFRACPSHQDFRRALQVACDNMPRPLSILVIGGAYPYTARSSDYAAQVAREVFASSDSCEISQLDVTPCDLHSPRGGSFDLIVTHSLAHYFFDLALFFQFVRTHMKPSSGYVIGQEPNRRFWANLECQRFMNEMETTKVRHPLGKYLRPANYVSWITRRVAQRKRISVEDLVNAALRKQFEMRGTLTLKEIHRMTDPHFPDELPGVCRMGSDGLDWEQSLPAWLPGCTPVWIGTARHLGKTNPRLLPSRWQETASDLAARYPLDGSVFSAFFHNPGRS